MMANLNDIKKIAKYLANLCLSFSHGINRKNSTVFTIINKKKIEVLFTRNYLRHSIHSRGISEMCTKKINIFKDIKLENFNSFTAFFSIYKNHYFIYALTRLDS